MRIVWVAVFASSLLQGLSLGSESTPDIVSTLSLKKFTSQEVTIYYEPCFEEQLTLVAKMYHKYQEKYQKDSQVSKNREAIVADICNIVGCSEADQKKATESFDSFLKTTFPLVEATTIYLLLQSTSKEYVKAGGCLPNLTYDKQTDTASYQIQYSNEHPSKQEQLLIPVAEAEQVESFLTKLFSPVKENIFGHMLIHEIAEIAILRRMQSPDPYKRWFSDGFANAITFEILRRHLSQNAADEFLKSYSTERYQPIKKHLNLQYWMSGEYLLTNSWPLDQENTITHARYCFATQEARRIVNQYGIECVRKIFDTYAASGLKQQGALLTAIQQATGDNIDEHLRQYQQFANREDGFKTYFKNLYEGSNDAVGKVVNLLRLLELCEQPFSNESLNLRKTIGCQLYGLGHKTTATEFIQQYAELLCKSNPENRYAGNVIVILYALEINQPDLGFKVAHEILKEKAEDTLALTLVMYKARQDGDLSHAKEIAKQICRIEPDTAQMCHKKAKEILEL